MNKVDDIIQVRSSSITYCPFSRVPIPKRNVKKAVHIYLRHVSTKLSPILVQSVTYSVEIFILFPVSISLSSACVLLYRFTHVPILTNID